MTQTRSKFCYKALDLGKDQIRLLTLLREPDEDGRLRCEIATFDLAIAPEFQALSYEWGSPEQLWDMRVEDGLLSIRQNLWVFLEMFREAERNDIFLWIDQICINQDDDAERGHQVKLMGSVYTKSVRTVVWLGSSEGVDTAISEAFSRHGPLLSGWQRKGVHCEVDHVRAEGLCIDGNCAICNWTFRRGDDRSLDARDRDAWNSSVPADNAQVSHGLANNLQDLCDLIYWDRLWIIQENVLAKECIFFLGHHRYSRYDIEQYCTLQERFYHRNPRNSLKTSHVSALTQLVKPISDLTLEQVIIKFSKEYLAYSDPHDVIYALLGLFGPTHRIPVDYQSTLPEVHELLMNAIILSPTLVQTLQDADSEVLHFNLHKISQRLGLTPLWTEWLGPVSNVSLRTETKSGTMNEFLKCLGYLEQVGLLKGRWTAYELGAIMHTIRQIRHAISLPLMTYKSHSGPWSKPLIISECTDSIESINSATPPDLASLLSAIAASAKNWDRAQQASLSSWQDMFRFPVMIRNKRWARSNVVATAQLKNHRVTAQDTPEPQYRATEDYSSILPVKTYRMGPCYICRTPRLALDSHDASWSFLDTESTGSSSSRPRPMTTPTEEDQRFSSILNDTDCQ